MTNRCLFCIHTYVKSFILFNQVLVFRLCHFEFFLFVFVSIIELTYNYRKHFFLPRCATAMTVLAEVSLITALSKYNVKRNGIHFD